MAGFHCLIPGLKSHHCVFYLLVLFGPKGLRMILAIGVVSDIRSAHFHLVYHRTISTTPESLKTEDTG